MPKKRLRNNKPLFIAASPAKYRQARCDVEAAVASQIEDWAATIGLTRREARFAQFREDVTEALYACMREHISSQYRRYRRYSDVRRDFLALAKAADVAAAKLHVVDNAVRVLPMPHDPAFSLRHNLDWVAFEMEDLTAAARRAANDLKPADRGGPPKRWAFELLAEGLVRAYRQATGQTGRERSDRERSLCVFASAVLPAARKIAKSVTGVKLETSSEDGLGEYLHRVAGRR
jgi:hypothetical protein